MAEQRSVLDAHGEQHGRTVASVAEAGPFTATSERITWSSLPSRLATCSSPDRL